MHEVAKDVLLEEEEAIEAHIELVMVGEEYEILGVDVADTGGPSSWSFSIEDLVVAQDNKRDLEILLKWMRTHEEFLSGE